MFGALRENVSPGPFVAFDGPVKKQSVMIEIKQFGPHNADECLSQSHK